MTDATPRATRRILIISPEPFFEFRGTPIRVLHMVKALCRDGYEVHLATYPIGTPVDVPGLVHHRSHRVPGISQVPIGFSPQKIIMDAMLALTVWRLLLSKRFDVVHAVEESVFFALFACRLRGTRTIFDMNSSVAHQLEYTGKVRSKRLLRLARAIQAFALRHVDMAITPGSALTAEGVRGLGASTPVAEIEDCPIEESPRPIRPEVVAELRRRFGLEDRPVAVYTGNLAAYQGLDLLYQAAPILAARCPKARILIVGGQAEQIDEARAAAEGAGAAGTIIFAGNQPLDLIPEFMAMADALISPRSGGQNTPLKLYSYMHSGVPIVATDLLTHRQVLDPETAVLCPPTPLGLGEALAQALMRPADFAPLAAAARERVGRLYSHEEFARKLLNAYDGLFAGTRSSRAMSM